MVRIALEIERARRRRCDPFLPVLMIVGMAHHLAVEVPEVSKDLLHGCRRIMEIYEAWSTGLGDHLRAIPIRASTSPRRRTGRVAGALFSVAWTPRIPFSAITIGIRPATLAAFSI